MAMIIKCKMCGGDIEATSDMTIGKCRYCGSTMTLPRIESDKKARLFNKANDYRLNNEFDKAYDAYKSIVEEDEQEAEAYWGMILSEYGIEYVEDPNTHKRIPTCHRTHVQNIRSSTNYQLAIKYADAERRFMYQDEAEALDKLQRTILSVSSKIEPYDVFISYKESANDGQRTADSVLAQEIYDALEAAGVRTFFSRVSLEEHLGENYEPYIYAALTSAKVMLVVATQGEYCDSVWVRNEWSRFLRFMDEDASKSIVPVYKDMTPYDFPMELSSYQAQDMSKVGAIQDLVRGVRKLLGKTPKQANDAAINTLLEDKRAREAAKEKRIRALRRTFITFGVIIILAGISFGVYWFIQKNYIQPRKNYEMAISLAENGDYENAIRYLEQYSDYRDSSALSKEYGEKIREQRYQIAIGLINEGKTEDAIKVFVDDLDYKKSYEYFIQYVPEVIESKLEENYQSLEETGEILGMVLENAKNESDVDSICDRIVQFSNSLYEIGDYINAGYLLEPLHEYSYKDAEELYRMNNSYMEIAKGKLEDIMGIWKQVTSTKHGSAKSEYIKFDRYYIGLGNTLEDVSKSHYLSRLYYNVDNGMYYYDYLYTLNGKNAYDRYQLELDGEDLEAECIYNAGETQEDLDRNGMRYQTYERVSDRIGEE